PIFFLLHQVVHAQLKLPGLVRDSMILQRDAKINIWGWASPKEKVRINFNGKKYKTISNTEGKWLVQFSPMKAGGPYTMEISGKNSQNPADKIVLKEILI